MLLRGTCLNVVKLSANAWAELPLLGCTFAGTTTLLRHRDGRGQDPEIDEGEKTMVNIEKVTVNLATILLTYLNLRCKGC
jgi:hypothetical protein